MRMIASATDFVHMFESQVFEPRTFIVELVGVLSRFKRRGEVKSVLDILNFVNIIS